MRKGRTDSTLSSLLDYAARGILHPLAPHIYLGCGVLEPFVFLRALPQPLI